MLLLEANRIKKTLGDRLLFSCDQLRIKLNDRIGIVGRNGTGKTTLLNILASREQPDQGEVITSAQIEIIPQLKEAPMQKSGGEITQTYLHHAFAKAPDLILADEPTTNLDMQRVEQLEHTFARFNGAIVVISHDREFLDKVCTQIWQIEEQTITVYQGNYSEYTRLKELEERQQLERYEKYQKKKKQLEMAIQLKKQKAAQMIKPPSKRMGYSESKLWKMQKGTKQKGVHQSIKALETRIDKLEDVDQPKELPTVKMNVPSENRLQNRMVLRADLIEAQINGKTLWSDVSFQVRNGETVAIMGANGSGKTTLIKKILEQAEGIEIGPDVKVGYFSQNLDILNPEQTILENVKQSSIHADELIRTVLARLLFIGDDVFKKVNILSGGERVKIAFAKIFLSDMNVLIMDEPTNFLDIAGIEALEHLLGNYGGTIILVSHDRKFVEKLATKILDIKDQSVYSLTGSYQEYQESKLQEKRNFAEDELLQVETKITEIISKLAENPSDDLEEMFQRLVHKRNDLRKQCGLQ